MRIWAGCSDAGAGWYSACWRDLECSAAVAVFPLATELPVAAMMIEAAVGQDGREPVGGDHAARRRSVAPDLSGGHLPSYGIPGPFRRPGIIGSPMIPGRSARSPRRLQADGARDAVVIRTSRAFRESRKPWSNLHSQPPRLCDIQTHRIASLIEHVRHLMNFQRAAASHDKPIRNFAPPEMGRCDRGCLS